VRVLYVRVDTPKAELAQPENAAEQRKCTHENTWSATYVRVMQGEKVRAALTATKARVYECGVPGLHLRRC